MAQRQRRAGLDLAEREAGVQVLHVGQAEQRLHRPAGIGVEVGDEHLQLEGAGAADVVAGDDLRQAADGVLQHARGVGVVALGVHAHEGQNAQADLAAVDLGAVARDDAQFLQPPHAAPGGRRRQPDARCQVGVGLARVALELAQQRDVVAIEPAGLARLGLARRRWRARGRLGTGFSRLLGSRQDWFSRFKYSATLFLNTSSRTSIKQAHG